jgi:hypothetical protein
MIAPLTAAGAEARRSLCACGGELIGSMVLGYESRFTAEAPETTEATQRSGV